QVAAYALDNPDEIAFGTAASVAASAGVQPSTLVRFAQHLGYDGFSSLQSVFRGRLRERPASYDERLEALRGEGPGRGQNRAILEGFVAAATRSLETVSHRIDDQALERAVATLASAGTIYLLARRRAFAVASHIAYALGKLGIRCHLVESSAGLDAEILALATPADAVIAISFSPYTPATIDGAREVARRGVPVVAITDSAFSPLAQSAAVWFELAEADCAGFRSLAASMALSMTLAVAVAERRRAD
ncbi:MAG: MurR/RpiR family transcriptional regulator, partial [Rhizobiaceae bacterium]